MINFELIIITGTVVFLILSLLFIFLAYEFRKKINRDQNEFYKSIIQCEISERQRIAKEIHDGIGGLLGMAKFHLSNLQGIKELPLLQNIEIVNSIKLIDLATEESRNISNELLPASIVRFGLKGAVQDLIKIYKTQFNVDYYFNCNCDINITLQANMYRIINELLNNSRKYANANNVEIDIVAGFNKILMHYSDNGIGFDFNQMKQTFEGNGLRNIENRVTLFNGKFQYSNNNGSIYNFEFQV